jgi:hypothetical protein
VDGSKNGADQRETPDLAEERPERPSIDVALSVVEEGPSDNEEQLVADALVERDDSVAPEEAALSERDSLRGPRTTTIPISPTRTEREAR